MSSNEGERLRKGVTDLRYVLGDEPKEQELIDVLRKANYDTNAALDIYFGGEGGGAAPTATPIAQPVAPPPDVVQVTVPEGVRTGQEIQVQTSAGLMRVTVPEGATPGSAFLVRLPPPQRQQPMQYQQQQPMQYQQPYQQYPGQQPMQYQQQQQQPNVVVVNSSP